MNWNFGFQRRLFLVIWGFFFLGIDVMWTKLVAGEECLGAPYIYIDLHGGNSDDPSDTNQIFMYSRNGCDFGTILSEEVESSFPFPFSQSSTLSPELLSVIFFSFTWRL